MVDLMGIRRRLLLAVGLISMSALIVGCGGGSSGSTPVDDPPVADAIIPGAQLARGLGNHALVGQSYSASVVVVPNDKRNAVVGLAIANPTPGGATPSIDPSGAVTWAPNEADFASTLELTVTATLREGDPATFAVPVRVRKERLVHQQALPAAAGSIADPRGRYLIRVEPEAAGTRMSGTLSISEVYSANGSFTYVVRVPAASGARVKVLDAPESLVPAPRASASAERSGGTRSAPGRATRLDAAGAAPDMEADVGTKIGPWFGSGDGLGRFANVGEVNVHTTRTTGFYYARDYGGNREHWSAEREYVYQVDANCKTAAECAAIKSNDSSAVTRGPVILVHGFNLGQSVSGGEGTWGTFASALKASGHPVFELRWVTYMRFEEAAGLLSSLSARVAQITGSKVTVVAHSFGGVVAHLSMLGQGIRYQGDGSWKKVPVDGVYHRLITLGSPLSGISSNADRDLNLVAGRDGDDLTISNCEAITCFQAGSSAMWDNDEIGDLVEKVSAIDSQRIGLADTRAGDTIRALHQAWESGGGHDVNLTTVVSLTSRPFKDYIPDLDNTTAYDLGDGLIAIMGQAVVPEDFSANPFSAPKTLDIEGTLGPDFLVSIDKRNAADMEKVARNGREYYFALRAAHSFAQNILGSRYMIAMYPDNGYVNQEYELPAYHPLHYFIDSTNYLSEGAVAYTGPPEPPEAVVRGSVVRDGAPLGGEPVSFEIQNAETGQIISDAQVVNSKPNTGEVVFDAGIALAARFPGETLNVANFKVLLRAGEGGRSARVFRRADLASSVDLGTIDLTLLPGSALVAGRVIDGQTENSAIAGAEIYLMKGTDQSSELLRQVVDTATSRHLTADSTGRFATSELEPGYYSALVTKSGYVEQTQGSLYVSALESSDLTFSLLRILTGDQAAITLRWGAASDGASVSSDLDSHLRKFDSFGTQQYHIYYSNRTGSSTDSLDRDDTSYQGPETITLALDASARYVYFVHNYAAYASLLGPSRPTVSVRIGSVVRDFALSPGETGYQRYWKVFEVVDGEIVPCVVDCLVDSSP